ncbi:hypothetical protein NP493_2050g00000 [Ridgeia piscesae]|uniref:Uncharacterized protein n=1 Tax=Ridgeia piscesae TaxID=27915 RepID=A0AAD9JM74_RIDPI|nr:hypothetical protein NP493_2050g00000 [Ridgeia piscesae]
MALARTSGHVLANPDNMAVFWSRRKQLELQKTLQLYVYLQIHPPMAYRKSEWLREVTALLLIVSAYLNAADQLGWAKRLQEDGNSRVGHVSKRRAFYIQPLMEPAGGREGDCKDNKWRKNNRKHDMQEGDREKVTVEKEGGTRGQEMREVDATGGKTKGKKGSERGCDQTEVNNKDDDRKKRAREKKGTTEKGGGGKSQQPGRCKTEELL